MTRPGVSTAVSVLLVVGIAAVQRFVTSPGRITYAEFRLLLLAAIPAMVTIVSAYWVNDGRRDRDRG